VWVRWGKRCVVVARMAGAGSWSNVDGVGGETLFKFEYSCVVLRPLSGTRLPPLRSLPGRFSRPNAFSKRSSQQPSLVHPVARISSSLLLRSTAAPCGSSISRASLPDLLMIFLWGLIDMTGSRISGSTNLRRVLLLAGALTQSPLTTCLALRADIPLLRVLDCVAYYRLPFLHRKPICGERHGSACERPGLPPLIDAQRYVEVWCLCAHIERGEMA
jgi:hypothetical protein